MKNNILLVTQVYYPHNGPASHRISSFAKYLPEHGFIPTVLCMNWDRDNCSNYSNTHNPYDPQTARFDVCDTVRIPYLLRPPNTLDMLFERLMPLSWPLEFHRKLLAEVKRLSASRAFSVLLATSPKLMPLSVAASAAKYLKIPWIADLRDISSQFILGRDSKFWLLPARWLFRTWAVHQEFRVCKTASAVITVSKPLADSLIISGLKNVHVVTNGYEAEDYSDIEEINVNCFQIVYAGTLSGGGGRYLSYLFKAIDMLLEKNDIYENDFELCFYGVAPHIIDTYIEGHNCRKVTKLKGRVSRREIQIVMKNATILLQLGYKHEKGILTSKVFEYLGAQRPILSVPSDEGVIDELLTHTGAGFSGTTPAEVANIIKRYYSEWKDTDRVLYHGNPEVVSQYTRKAQAKKLADILESVIDKAQVKDQK